MRSYLFILLLFLSARAFGSDERVVVYKEQQKSLINWEKMDPNSWLDLARWKVRTDAIATAPDWEKNLRARELTEVVGRVLSCIGSCKVYRGQGHHQALYLSELQETDEIETDSESYAWIILLDGTMVRLSPQTSVTFREINIGIDKNFLQARLNHGNILWLARTPYPYMQSELRETDSLFLPLSLFAANREIPIRDVYGSEKNDDILYNILVGDTGLKEHIERLNSLVETNNKQISFKPTTSLLVMGNGSVLGENVSMEAIVTPGKETLFKLRTLEEQGIDVAIEKPGYNYNQAKFQYRGYENSELISLEIGRWYSVDERGRELRPSASTSLMRMNEFLTKRIYTLVSAREMWLDRDYYFAQTVTNPLTLATEYGYRMWGMERNRSGRTDSDLRLSWLLDYSRRIETTSLQTASLFREKLKERGEEWEYVEFGTHSLNRALVNYIKKGEAPFVKEGRGPVLQSTSRLLWRKINSLR